MEVFSASNTHSFDMLRPQPSLFSIRNLILILISLCSVRSLGNTIEAFPTALSPVNSFIVIEGAVPSNNGSSELDALLLQTERERAQQVIGDDEFFILASGPEINARQWLAFLAPENTSFDLTMQQSATLLQSLANFSPGLNPFQIFLGIDLADIQSTSIESFFLQDDLPTFIPTDFIETEPSSVPEPSATLLALIGIISALFRRKRFARVKA